MVLTRSALTRATFPIAAATAFLLRGNRGPWGNASSAPKVVAKTIGAAAAAGASMAYGAYKLRSYMGRRKKRSYGPFRLRTMRFRRRRYGRRPRFSRRSKRSTGQRYNAKAKPRPLKSLMVGNDYKRIRFATTVGQISCDNNVLTPNTDRFYQPTLASAQSQGLFSDEIADYREAKLLSCQWVIQPMSLIKGDQNITLLSGNLPYLCVRDVPANITGPVGNTSSNQLRVTPGYKYVRLFKKARTVINSDTRIYFQDSVATSAGSITAKHLRSFPWMENTPSGVQTTAFCAIEVVRPYIEGLAALENIKYDIHCYQEWAFRGDLDTLKPPES